MPQLVSSSPDSMSTRVTAPVPFFSSSTRTLKSVELRSRSSARVEAADGDAQRLVERVDGAVALGGRDVAVPADVDLDGGLGHHAAVLALLGDDAERLERKSGS